MAGDRQTSKVDAAIERLHAAARSGDVGALLFEVEAKILVDPERILREAFSLLHELAPVPVTRAALARLAPLFPKTEAFQNDLGFLLHISGDPEGAAAAFGFSAERREERVARHPLASTGLRIVHPAWLAGSFGEMAVRLNYFAKFRSLGMLPPWQVVLPAPQESIVNEPLLDLFAPYVNIVKSGDLLAKTQSLAADLALDLTCLPMADGRFLYVQDAFRAAEHAWAAAGRAPLLSLSPSRLSAGRASLARIGLPADAWFVAMHVRDPAFHGEAQGRSRADLAARDADVMTYLPAIERIVARGGHVLRLGSNKAPALPGMPGFVDYAHSEVRSPELDLVAIAAARFMIATASGPAHVSTAFGTPTIHTNAFPTNLHVAARDIWLPKIYRRRADGRTLDLAESLSAPFRGDLRGSGFGDYGIELVANEPEDIAAACDEMLDRLDGRAPGDDPEVAGVFDRTGNLFIAPISACYLARHRAVLLPGR